ncbi:ribonuclease PH, partial [candidate division WOR-3 bacterium]|nr:ribonuclease PH [candidate division WOR-3 bacterium]
DSVADVDMNVVMTDDTKIIEIQATAEGRSFSSEDLNKLLKLSEKGIKELIEKQRDALSLTLAM